MITNDPYGYSTLDRYITDPETGLNDSQIKEELDELQK